MSLRVIIALCFCLQIAPPPIHAQSALKSSPTFLHELGKQSDAVERYRYLITALALMPEHDQLFARQFLSFTESELGLYGEAVRDFPVRNQLPSGIHLPKPTTWEAVDAVETICALAANRKLVMVNEAHHDAHSRILTLALLPCLRAKGFTHFAAEALDYRDTNLTERGYPVVSSGSEYLQEPLYGDIVREAIRLGYVIVPYETDKVTPQERDNGQAQHLYERVFAKNSKARLFVHAGYAHIDKSIGRLNHVRPMAMQLAQLSGIEPLTIDQTDIREDSPTGEAEALNEAARQIENGKVKFDPAFMSLLRMQGKPKQDAYHQLLADYEPQRPIAFRQMDGDRYWSARPHSYDMNVILPKANPFPSDYTRGPVTLALGSTSYLVLPPAADGHRPPWLALEGQRKPFPIDSNSCANQFPCLIEAIYAHESNDATAADRYLYLQKDNNNRLYLRPGKYRLRTLNTEGNLLAERPIEIADK